MLFYILMFIIPIGVWIGIEILVASITDRFEPLKKDSKKGTLYLNQDYYDDFFLYEFKESLTTSASNRAIYSEKKNRFRIFCLGGSTTAGYPYNNFPTFKCPSSFPNYLRAILQYNRSLPDVEILNAGATALNSLNVRHLFKDLLKYKPDAVVIYSGHNEYFGPNEFAVSKEKTLDYQQPGFYFPFMRIRRTYLYQGLKKLIGFFTSRFETKHQDYLVWSQQNYVLPNDPINEQIAENYRRNVTEIVKMAKAHHIKLILCTPVTNVAFPPFISKFNQPLDTQTAARFDSLDNAARMLYGSGKIEPAYEIWNQLKQIDSTYADLYYHSGMALARLKKYEQAAKDLYRAKECDAFPFRAKNYIGEILREIAREEQVILVDVEKFFEMLSAKYYPEPSYLLDHVHPTDEGYYYLALYLARVMIENNVFAAARRIRYPTYKDCRAVLDINELAVDKIEFEFPLGSYFERLKLLNPEIQTYLHLISTRAKKRAEAAKKEDFLKNIYDGNSQNESQNQ